VVATLATAAVGIAQLAFSGGAGAGPPVVTAEFTNARGLVEGNDVRVDGAPAGTVSHLELTDRGTALVTLELHDGIEPPRADATAAIRPVDLIGDNYVALDLGSDPAPLDGDIPPSRTLNEPRLDDLLRSFGTPERTGIEAMLVEGGIALDQRGADLNQAALALRPALEATDSVLTELNSQTADLRDFVTAADRASGEAASRDEDLGRMVGALDATLQATADHPEALDQALAGAPQSISDLQRIAPRLEAVAKGALPLAESLNRSAPGLATAADRAVGFLGAAGQAIERVDPIVSQATDLLATADPTLTGFDSGFSDLVSIGPDYQRFLDALVPAAPSISEGFFVNFPDEAAEPGNQPFDPFADPRRHYWRGAAVFTCQSFGLPIKPGCLQDFLARNSADDHAHHADHDNGDTSTGDRAPGGGAAGGDQPSPEQPSAGGLPIDPPDLPHTGNQGLDDTTEQLGDLLDTLLGQ
jgi:phospholipid/cholesterol/gamma-HCH transport system substrate-binding protein